MIGLSPLARVPHKILQHLRVRSSTTVSGGFNLTLASSLGFASGRENVETSLSPSLCVHPAAYARSPRPTRRTIIQKVRGHPTGTCVPSGHPPPQGRRISVLSFAILCSLSDRGGRTLLRRRTDGLDASWHVESTTQAEYEGGGDPKVPRAPLLLRATFVAAHGPVSLAATPGPSVDGFSRY